MKRVGTALLAALMVAAMLGAGGAHGAAKPLTVRIFDPFWFLVEPRHEPQRAVGSTIGGCQLRPATDCSGDDLTEDFHVYDISGADLSRSNLRHAIMRGKLNGASLAGADLTGANLNGTGAAAVTAPFARFGKADLGGFSAPLGRFVGAHFRGAAEAYETSFFAADLADADLRGTNLGRELAGAVLSGADLRGVDLREHDLEFADLSHAKLDLGALKGADLCDTVLPSGKVADRRKRCELPPIYIDAGAPQPTIQPSDPRYSLLRDAAGTWRSPHRERCGDTCPEGGQWLTHLRGPSHAYAHLAGTHRFAGRTIALVNLTGADLSGANLERAVMPGAAASSVDFQDADLEGADLTYAELAGSNLETANLAGADARQADLTRADLNGANLSGARLGATSLVEADLSGANFAETDLSGADLFGAEVDASFPGAATLCDTVMPDGTVAGPTTGCEHR